MNSIDVFLPNRMEALRLARISSLDAAIARLRAAGAGMVVVKDGEDGAVGAQAGEILVAHARSLGLWTDAESAAAAGSAPR